MRRLTLLVVLFCLATVLQFDLLTPVARSQTNAEPAEPLEGEASKVDAPSRFSRAFEGILADVNTFLARIIFFDILRGSVSVPKVDRHGNPVIDETSGGQEKTTVGFPFIVAVLVLGAVLFTFWFRWINIRGFWHGIEIIRGRYDDPKDIGQITHFRALASALSGTVGLGNIAGVAIAIQLGGPGAVFWMILAAIFGMSTKFNSCTLAQLYRKVNNDGSVSGGPMYYLDLGFRRFGKPAATFGKILAAMYALMIIGGALGGGSMFGSNQSFEAVSFAFGVPRSFGWLFGFFLAIAVAIVVLGGITRIGAAAARIVPSMAILYIFACLAVLLSNLSRLPESISLIFRMAFSDNAFYGGVLGVLVMGMRRAVFSNEAGLGSAAIAHAAAKTDEPVREGLVAMIGPFIDTVLICSMTALVVIASGAWQDPTIPQSAGSALTTAAFRAEIPGFGYVLTICILLFAFSTMITWCYYGERGCVYLLDNLGMNSVVGVRCFRLLFILSVFSGSILTLESVLTFSDLMILSMSFPNIVGGIILAPVVSRELSSYIRRQRGQAGSSAAGQ